jgi:hypothetical protein
MMLVKSFLAEGKEYMVLDGRQGFMPGPAAVRLLMDSQEGIGGDRLVVLTGSAEHPFLMVFLPDGTVVSAGAKEQVLLRGKAAFELRVTDSFTARLREADEDSESLKRAS